MEHIVSLEPSVITSCCRICLGKNGDFYDLFSEEQLEVGTTIAQVLRECTSYTLEPTDNLSHQICRSCYDNACFAYRFRRQADDSYRYVTGVTGQPQKSAMLLVEIGTQTETDTPKQRVRERSKFLQRNKNSLAALTDCKLCGALHVTLREHLMMEHVFSELTQSLHCVLCENQYSRKDHLVRHLRSIHKVTRDRDDGRINIEEPQTSVMGQWIDKSESKLDSTHEIISSPIRTTTVHRYWHAPEFVRSGNSTSIYKMTIPRQQTNDNNDPLENKGGVKSEQDDSNVIFPDITDVDEYDIKPCTDYLADVALTTFENSRTDYCNSTTSSHAQSPKFFCSICDRGFGRKYHMQRHMLIHSNERNFQCESCQRSFSRSDQITRHQREGCRLGRATNQSF